MAKKIIVNNPEEASNILKQGKIEHVLVEYPGDEPNTKGDVFLVIKNKDKNTALAALVDFNINRVKSIRHYKAIALNQYANWFIPRFDCKCRNCGKIFSSEVKEAVWCSIDCWKEFRNKRREANKAKKTNVG